MPTHIYNIELNDDHISYILWAFYKVQVPDHPCAKECESKEGATALYKIDLHFARNPPLSIFFNTHLNSAVVNFIDL